MHKVWGFNLSATFPFMVVSKRRALSLSMPIPESQPAYLFVDDIVHQFVMIRNAIVANNVIQHPGDLSIKNSHPESSIK
jgi:hypothetical protein